MYAIMTNRTLLVRYAAPLREKGIAGGPHVETVMMKNMCAKVLQVADWIPLENVWAEKLGIGEMSSRQLPRVLTRDDRSRDPDALRGSSGVIGNTRNATSAGDDIAPIGVIYPGDECPYVDWTIEENLAKLPDDYARSVARDLYGMGLYFLYGALFHHSLDFSQEVKESLPRNMFSSVDGSMIPDPHLLTTYTVAVQSRHIEVKDDGCDVKQEMRCLRELIAPRRSGQQKEPCSVVLLSDRECTLSTLRERVHSELNCTVKNVQHQPREPRAGSQEHGAFAGFGFYLDIAFAAAHSRNAVVSNRKWFERPTDNPVGFKASVPVRSSAALVRELIEYKGKMESILAGDSPRKVDHCLYTEDRIFLKESDSEVRGVS